MKKRWIVIAVIVVVLMMFVSRYSIVERQDILPEDLRGALRWLSGVAQAQEVPVVAAPPSMPFGQQVVVQFITPTPEPTVTPVPTPVPTPTPIPTPTPVPTPTPDATPEPLFESGDRGAEVRLIQNRLHELGFFTAKIDGIYGAKTEEAVKAFRQHVYDLAQERLAEEQARLEALEPIDAPVITEEPVNTEMPAETEVPATTEVPAGTEVPVNTEVPAGTEAPVNTEAPAATEAPVITEAPVATEVPAGGSASEQQSEEAELPVVIEGKVDEETYRLLMEGGFDEYQQKLTQGMQSVEVKRMQQRLKALGYLKGTADGKFGANTLTAVKNFQTHNKLTADGIAGEKTQRKLYSAAAVKAPVVGSIDTNLTPEQKRYNGTRYYLKVSTANQRVYAYEWNEADGAYNRLARTMVCSTGLADTPTPKGTFKETAPRVEWGYFPKFDVWAQYLYRISGPYLFHSVLYEKQDESTLKWGSVYNLGRPASHGCVRLNVEDARWIYKNCPAGTIVTVY